MTEKIELTEYVTTLPPSVEPWRLITFMGRVVAANAEHGTFIIEEGRAIQVASEGAGEVYAEAPQMFSNRAMTDADIDAALRRGAEIGGMLVGG